MEKRKGFQVLFQTQDFLETSGVMIIDYNRCLIVYIADYDYRLRK